MNALDAIGNPVRRQLLESLRNSASSVEDLASDFPISRPAISRHLRLLKDAGLVRSRTIGRQNIYELNPGGFEEIQGYLQDLWGGALQRFKLYAENTTND